MNRRIGKLQELRNYCFQTLGSKALVSSPGDKHLLSRVYGPALNNWYLSYMHYINNFAFITLHRYLWDGATTAAKARDIWDMKTVAAETDLQKQALETWKGSQSDELLIGRHIDTIYKQLPIGSREVYRRHSLAKRALKESKKGT